VGNRVFPRNDRRKDEDEQKAKKEIYVPEWFLEAEPDETGPDVMSPVVGRLGVSGPEFCLDREPEVLR
jgi:hypothetical protein